MAIPPPVQKKPLFITKSDIWLRSPTLYLLAVLHFCTYSFKIRSIRTLKNTNLLFIKTNLCTSYMPALSFLLLLLLFLGWKEKEKESPCQSCLCALRYGCHRNSLWIQFVKIWLTTAVRCCAGGKVARELQGQGKARHRSSENPPSPSFIHHLSRHKSRCDLSKSRGRGRGELT